MPFEKRSKIRLNERFDIFFSISLFDERRQYSETNQVLASAYMTCCFLDSDIDNQMNAIFCHIRRYLCAV